MSVVVISPHQPGVATMLADSDAYMAALYLAESNHMMDVSTLADPASDASRYRRGWRGRVVWGACSPG